MRKLQVIAIALLVLLPICALASMEVSAQSASLSHFVFSSISGSRTAGSAFAITITAKAANGNTVTNYNGVNSLSVSTGTITPTSTTNFVSGVWSGQVTLSHAGSGISISTSGGGKSGTSNTFTVNAGALDRFIFDTINSPQTAGKGFNIKITAKDSSGNTVTSYTGTNSLTASSGIISPTSTNKFSNGVWTGSVSLSASSSATTITTVGSSKSGTSSAFAVDPGALDHFVFSNIGPQTAGTAFSVTITAKDSNDNTVTAYSGSNALSVSSGTISPQTTGAFSSGTWTGLVTLSAPGSAIRISTSGSSKPGQSNSFAVAAASLSHFVISSISSPRTAGSAFTITITAKAASGNTISSYNGANTLSVSSGTITPVATPNFVGGVWSGQITLSAAESGVSISTSGGGKSGESNTFTVNPGAATRLAVSSGTSQIVGVPFSVTVTALDAYGNTATSYTGRIRFSSSDFGSGVKLPSDYRFLADDLGTHTFDAVTLVTASSSASVTATDTSSSSIRGSQLGIIVATSGALSNVLISPVNSSVTAGLSKTFLATASDSYGNTWDVTSSTLWSISAEAGGSWKNNTYTSAAAGSWIVTGTYASKPYNTILTVNSAPLNFFVFNSVVDQAAGYAFNLTVTAKDAFNNIVTGYVGTPSLTCSAGVIYPKNMNSFVNGVGTTSVTLSTSALNVTIGVADGVRNGTSNTFNVNPSVLASAGAGGLISPSGRVSINYGGSQTFNIVADAGYKIADVFADNVSLGPVSSYTFTGVRADHTINASFAIHTYSISASAGAGGSINPNGITTVNYGDSLTFNITANDGYYIVGVSVNGSSIGAVNSYTFNNVQDSYSISAVFAPTPTSSPSPTLAPTPTSTTNTTPPPTATPPISPTPSATTVTLITDGGTTIDLEMYGNITSSHISNATITTYQSTQTTSISFTVAGPNATVGFSNMTIPKALIPYGTDPIIYVDGQPAANQGYTQDANNFYVWYIVQFSTHFMEVQFVGTVTSQTLTFGPLLAVAITVPEIIIVYTVIAVRRLKRKPENA